MKLWLLGTLGLLGAAGAAQGQKLRGGYRLEIPKGRPALGTSVYWFGNGRFRHLGGGCVGGAFDEGSFVRAGNRLTLRYDKWQQPASTFTAAPLAGDSARTTLEVLVLDAQTKQPLRGISVCSNRRQDARYLSDEAGRVLAEWPQWSAATDTITVSRYLNAGYEPLRIPARLVPGRHLTVWLAPTVERRASGSVEKFLIQLLTPTTLTLQFADPDLAAYSLRYSRLSAAETRRVFSAAD